MDQLDSNATFHHEEKPPVHKHNPIAPELGKAYRIQNIYFAFDSAVLQSNSFPALDSLYEVLNQYTDFQVEIIGHTDSLGSSAYNSKLSQDRAEAVRRYFIEKGMNPT